tara:strand:+ start:1288 stop:1458 length:171 start_codon:yes stop_codon:yes gene_type:complete
MDKVNLSSINQKVNDHEKLCLEKYDNIKMRLVRIEAMIITGTAAVIALLVQLSFFN